MKRSVWITSGMVALVLLLVGGAFVGGRLLSDEDRNNRSEQKMVLESGVMIVSELLDVQNAEELPDIPPDVAGLFVQREDNRLFVGTGNLSGVVVGGDEGGASRWEYHHDGPVAEVVTTHDTLVYRDDTLQQLRGGPPSGPIKQVLNPGSLDEMGKNSTVEAWGERRGDHVVAEAVVFTQNP